MRRLKNSTAAASTVDTISSLPDAILCHILYFLTTKEAVATSILSKRWIHLWHHVHNLNFPDIKVETVRSSVLFNEFVYSVLLSREIIAGYNVMNSFTLDIRYDNPHLAFDLGFPNIRKWINVAVQRKLEHLCIRLDVDNLDDNGLDYDADYPNLPVSIFTCRTLVSLDLCWFRVKGFSFSGFQFPSLKTLNLKWVNFSKVRDFMLFIAGCPILEDLHISQMDFFLEKDSLTLQLQEFKRLSLPKLKRAEFVQFGCQCFPVNALSTVEYLCINTLKVNQLQRPYDVVTIFHNLTDLLLHYHNRWDLVLHQCPKLQNLQLSKGLCDPMWCEKGQENWVEPEFVPQCLLSSLRSCTIHDFSDLQSELMLEQYILKNAIILQTMTIWCKTEQPEMESKLSICPMASETCELSLCC
ncbi:FBD-associated F-box protein At4g10400-like isoform X1 [Trifolium pratense]|uniref:FBD-associated F-box protein At4g10400-like isoform X1 n=1 Tax=Trifolium pratense TaxID=57577 RepID=UPI001E691E56|nr:FBD-associated F-box protein At4g10400-like isoform X1 [Trifolium pratense]XP_045817488.1 FBD-associated F-box protein At4g10400-like isoform X1 [Trifolium pratense]